MSNIEKAMAHLRVIYAYMSFALKRGTCFLGLQAVCDIEERASDALALLKEQEEKKGKWIPIESPTGVEAFGVKEMTVMNVRCSVCGSEEDVSFTGYKYCPRCGAKMEGR